MPISTSKYVGRRFPSVYASLGFKHVVPYQILIRTI